MNRSPAIRGTGRQDLASIGRVEPARPRSSLRTLLAGLPCVALAMALVGAPVVAQFRNSTWQRYSWALVNHLNRGEMPASLVCLKRLLTLDPGRPELIFMMAQVYDRQGKTEWAEALALALAPANRPGYPPARRWLAQRAGRAVPAAATGTITRADATAVPPPGTENGIPPVGAPGAAVTTSPARDRPGTDPVAGRLALVPIAETSAKGEDGKPRSVGVLENPDAVPDRRQGGGSRGTARATETQLKEWLSEEPRSAEARTRLGFLYAETGRFAEARTTLEPLAAGRPVLLLTLAKCAAALGDQEAMRRYARETSEAARQIAIERPDEPAARSVWALACSLLDDYQGALDVLGGPNAPPATAARKAEMATVCATWARFLEQSKSGKVPEILAIVQLGLSYDETNEALLTDLAGLLSNGGNASRDVAAALQMMIRERRTPVPAWYALGMDAWVRGRAAEARRCWEQAYLLNPRILVLANNLAWNLATTGPADPARGLSLIDRALAEGQSDRRLRVTRGEILGKLGRWEEAAAELERALTEGEDTAKIQPALAEAYRHLGRTGRGPAPGAGPGAVKPVAEPRKGL